MEQELLWIDATPNETYPLRILQSYRRLGDSVWSSSSSMKINESHPLIKALNEEQKRRNELLDEAIATLAAKLVGFALDTI